MSLIFRPIEIMSKKARRNDVDFLLIEVTLNKVRQKYRLFTNRNYVEEGKLIRHRCVDNQNNIKKVRGNDMEIC